MKAKEIRDLSATEIEKRLRDSRTELLKLRLGRQTGQVEKTHELHFKRRDIARLETIRLEKRRTEAAS